MFYFKIDFFDWNILPINVHFHRREAQVYIKLSIDLLGKLKLRE